MWIIVMDSWKLDQISGNLEIGNIFDVMDFNFAAFIFHIFHVYLLIQDFWIFRLLDFQIPRFPNAAGAHHTPSLLSAFAGC